MRPIRPAARVTASSKRLLGQNQPPSGGFFWELEARTRPRCPTAGPEHECDETIDFRLTAHPKDISLLSARTPVIIRGTLKEPASRPEVTTLAAKGAASVALGALLTPVAAILPWVELGLGQDSPCRALLDAATKKEELRKPRAK